jgi:xanthine dehydrogenase YagT iron-sulfur-binding subunit
MHIHLKVNGTDHGVEIDPTSTLLDVLRDRLGLTGTKRGCDMGACGACTVLIESRCANACLALAASFEGHAVETIEGIGQSGVLHPLQSAFIEHDALQCGFCTPGQIMAAISMLNHDEPGSDTEIRELMSGNLCRCGAYPNIVDAIQSMPKPSDHIVMSTGS